MQRKTLTAIAIWMALASPAFAQQPTSAPDFSKVEIKTMEFGDRTHVLEGQGGNMTVAAARNGVILVDGKFAPLYDKITAATAAVSPQPVKYLGNILFHGDHTGGNAPFAKNDSTVIASIKVKTRLAAGTRNFLTGVENPPASKEALPTLTYTHQFKLDLKDRIAETRHVEHARTDGDTSTNRRYPNIDVLNGGNIKGMIAATDAYLKLANDKIRFLPGHGTLGDKAALTGHRTMLVTARDRMAKPVMDGKSEAEVLAAKPYAELDTTWAPSEQASKNLVRVVYHSLADKPDAKS